MACVVFRRSCPTIVQLMAVLLAFAAPMSNAAAAVFGVDERQKLAGAEQEIARYVGLLKSHSDHSSCTAICLAKDVIATAGHCINTSDQNARSELKSITFRPFSERHRSPARIAGAAIDNVEQSIITGNKSLRVTPPISAAHDWALIKLDRPACRAGGLPLETSQTDSPDALVQIAFHHDLGADHLYRGGPCKAINTVKQNKLARIGRDFVDSNQLLFHHCDAEVGSSGSPLLKLSQNRPAVAALNVGTYYLASRAKTAAARDTKDENINGEAVANTAITAAIFRKPLAELSGRSPLSTVEDIQRLSTALATLGHYAGPPATTLTPRLKFARQKFATSNALLEWRGVDQSLLAGAEQAARMLAKPELFVAHEHSEVKRSVGPHH